jgi:hypothetical protein
LCICKYKRKKQKGNVKETLDLFLTMAGSSMTGTFSREQVFGHLGLNVTIGFGGLGHGVPWPLSETMNLFGFFLLFDVFDTGNGSVPNDRHGSLTFGSKTLLTGTAETGASRCTRVVFVTCTGFGAGSLAGGAAGANTVNVHVNTLVF